MPPAYARRARGFPWAAAAVKPADIALFTRQMATMMRAGVPLVQSFEIVADGLDKPKLADLIRSVRNDVSGGSAFASALRKNPLYFDDLFCNLVDAGEQSGALETMLDRIATYKEKTESLKAKVRKAMTYPAAVLVVAFVVSGILLIKVVPQFEVVFQGFGAELPAFTQFVIGISEFTQQWWLVIIGAIAGGIAGLIAIHKRSRGFRESAGQACSEDADCRQPLSRNRRSRASPARCRQPSPPVSPWWTLSILSQERRETAYTRRRCIVYVTTYPRVSS